MVRTRGPTLNSRLLALTKFAPPGLPSRYVPRERLHTLLDASVPSPLTIVVGVPGAGKSVLLRSWLQDHPELPSVWLSCDERDANPVVFWRALVAALAGAWPERWFDVSDLLAETDPNLDEVAIAVVNDLVGLGEPVVMVIDDFHFAPAAAPALTLLIERLPHGCRVIVGSRSEPQLALHRLRIHGQVSEVRDGQLRLTEREVGELMREFDVELNDEEIELLTARTEGWMAGVQMAAVSMREQPNRERFLTDLARSPRAITDFLGTEVLDHQPSDIREFLLETSILDVLDAARCAAVTDRRDAAMLLEQVAERNLFLIELGDDAYRYHHLFGDLLRHRLRAEDPDLEHTLHERAAAHFLRVDDPENAIAQLLAAGRDADAFDVLRNNLVGSFYRGDGSIPSRLVAKVEAHADTIDVARLPDVALALAASGPSGEAERWITRADRHIAVIDDAGRDRLAIARALVALRHGEALDIELALASFEHPDELPEEDRYGYVPSLLARSRLWLHNLDGARNICEQALASSDTPSAKQIVLDSGLAWIACIEGHLDEADQTADRALAAAQSLNLTGHVIVAEALRAKGWVAYERGDAAEAERLLEQSVSVSERLRPAFALTSQLLLADLWLADGRVSDAIDGITHARAFLPTESTSPLVDFCREYELRLALATGDLVRAGELSRDIDGPRSAILRVRTDVVRGHLDRADEALADFIPVTARERLDAAILAAQIAHARKSTSTEAAVQAALELARPERFVVAITDDMVELRPQVSRVLRSGRIGTFEQAVLQRIEEGPPATRNGNDGTTGPLSEREQTVLRYLASRLTYKEIATEIFVSTNTLKTHVQRIYRKLGVSSRSEAVAEARRLGLR